MRGANEDAPAQDPSRTEVRGFLDETVDARARLADVSVVVAHPGDGELERVVVGIELLERLDVRLASLQPRAELEQDLRSQAQDRARELPIARLARAVQRNGQIQ